MNTSSQQQVTVPFRDPSRKQIQQYFFSTWSPGMIAGIIGIITGIFFILVGILVFRLTITTGVVIILIAGGVALIGVVVFRQSLKSRLSDEEYDEWLKRRRRAIKQEVYSILEIDRNKLTDDVLSIHSFVLPGSPLAERYAEDTVLMKRGKDGTYRFSANFYTFIFPFSRTVAIFTMYFNTLTLASSVWQDEEYPWQHIIAVEISSSLATVMIENQACDCTLSRICLQIYQRDACRLGAYLKAIPTGSRDEAAITLPDSEIHHVQGRVRRLLRDY